MSPAQYPRPAWTAEEDRLVDRLARAVIARRYRSASAAIPDFRQTLARAGRPSRRLDFAIRVRISRRAQALGRRFRRVSWTDAELRVIGRFARAGLHARHSRNSIRERIRECAHEAGLPSQLRHWTAEERSILDRFARAAANGEYRSASEAARACTRELERSGSTVRRTEKAVFMKLRPRCRAAGWVPRKAHLTPGEQRVVDRYARRVAAGRISSVQKALPPCRRELARLNPRGAWTEGSVAHRLASRAHALGWPPVTRRWTAPEVRVLARYALALGQGRYPSAHAAARACRDALRRAGLGSLRSLFMLSKKLRRMAPGWQPRKVRWTPEEDRLVADFAREIHDGRYSDAKAALAPCCLGLSRLAPQTADAASARPRHTQHSVRARITEVASRLGPRPRCRWREWEKRVLDRYARAIARREYRSITQAATLCQEEIGRLDAQQGEPGHSGRARPPARSLVTVRDRLSKRAEQFGRVRRIQPRWSRAERRISAKWARRFGLHKLGRSRMGLQTMAGMMQGELRRRGYRRTRPACATEIQKIYRSGIT